MKKEKPVRYINYVITVHGIGDQRPNETVLPVINRFAENRQPNETDRKREVVTLGKITSQTGRPREIDGQLSFSDNQPWAEFKNIPSDSDRPTEPFLAEPDFTGENIRFTDMHWADIMQDEFAHVGQKTATWTRSLIGRLEMHKKMHADSDKKDGPALRAMEWILPVLYQLEDTLRFLDDLLSLRFPFLDDLIFNKFLGDIQLYGEYTQIRGRAVRRFHNLLGKMEKEHAKRHCDGADDLLEEKFENVRLLDESIEKLKNLLQAGHVKKVLDSIHEFCKENGITDRTDALREDFEQMKSRHKAGETILPEEKKVFSDSLETLLQELSELRFEQINEEFGDYKTEIRYFSKTENCLIKPRYIILAHSLGTVMAMDAILYGHIKRDVYSKVGKYRNLPFLGYSSDHETAVKSVGSSSAKSAPASVGCMGEDWVDNITAFVTLGSPIDKYLTLWWQNYFYTDDYDNFKTNRIEHYNYCDEQDPVGHNLNTFKSKPAYERIFKPVEDLVYNRYGTPGAAHVKYWTDNELFGRIIDQVIDGKKESDPAKTQAFCDVPKQYNRVIFYSYFLLPILSVLLTSGQIMWGWETESWKMGLISGSVLMATVFLFRKLIKLTIWWRQLLRTKSKSQNITETLRGDRSRTFKVMIYVVLMILVGSALLYTPVKMSLPAAAENAGRHMNYLFELGAIGLVSLLIYYVFYYQPKEKTDVRLNSLPEAFTLIYSAVLAGAIYVLMQLNFIPLYPILPYDKFYNDFLNILILNAAVTWIFVMNCYYAAKRSFKHLRV